MLVVARKKTAAQSTVITDEDESDGPGAAPGPQSHPGMQNCQAQVPFLSPKSKSKSKG